MKYLEKESDFDKLIEKGIVLVDFYAEWCGPCRMLGPVLEELEEERDNIEIVKVDIDQFMGLAKKYGIMSVPSLKVFKDGENTNNAVGYMDKEELEDLLS